MEPGQNELKLFGGTANPTLTREVCNYLCIEPGKITTKTFSDGEISVEIEENVRGQDVYIIQPLCDPVNNNLMELLIMADALKRSSVDVNFIYAVFIFKPVVL